MIAVVALSTAAFSVAGAGSAAAPQKIRITAAAKSSTAVLGEKVQITGSISPRMSGLPLLLQNYIRNAWQTDARTRVRANGTFSFSAQPRVRGRTSWRVTTAKGSARATGRSRVVTITALAWDWVNEFRPVTYDGGYDNDATTANGVHYAHPLWIPVSCRSSDGGEDWVEYDLGRRYQRLEATVSIKDDSPSGTSATYEVIVDGKMVFSSAVRLGVASHFDVNVTNGLRLKLLVRNTLAGQRNCPSGWAIFGNLRALGRAAPGGR